MTPPGDSPPTSADRAPAPGRARALIVALTVAVVVLGTLQVLHLSEGGSWIPKTEAELSAARAALLSRLSPGIMDSHPDGLVGRTLIPDLEPRSYQGVTVETNALGMRERPYTLPKPDGLVRAVVLGDSYVFGWAVEAGDRVGAVLEQLLVSGAGPDAPPIEVLHIAVPSWNLVSGATYVRRQLDLLRPDLVVQVAVPNDLDDELGVRGYGSLASFSPSRPQRADAILSESAVARSLGRRGRGPLTLGLDEESRTRYRAAGAAIDRLARALADQGGHYRLLVHFGHRNEVVYRHLAPLCGAQTLLWLPADFSDDPRLRVSDEDLHWSPDGHREVAELLYAVIRREELLPLALTERPAAAEALARLHERGREEALADGPAERFLRPVRARRVLDLAPPDPQAAAQIHGGIDGEGRAGPYASLLMPCDGAASLRVEGRGLGRSDLGAVTVGVWLDEVELTRAVVPARGALDLDLPVPPEVASRPFVSLRLQADDFVYAGSELRHAVAFQLERVALEP